MFRRTVVKFAAATAVIALGVGVAHAQELPKLKKKDTYKVGFAQTESNNPWRLAQTASMKDEAAEARLDSSSTPTPPARPPSRSPTSTR